MTEAITQTLEVSGARLTFDVRRNEASSEPILLLIASPMGAAGFTTLSKHFTDRTVVTYDPRGSERSVRTDGGAQSTPDEHADDLHRLISTLDGGPVEIFAEKLGKTPAMFPSNHGGFLGGEYGQTGDPDAFAAKLRDVLTEPR